MKPLLILPSPAPSKAPKNKPFTPPTIHYPTPVRQQQRLGGQFTHLNNIFLHAALADDPAGYIPERTLVLETIGSVQNIQKALSKIPGFEVLEDLEGDEIEADDDFYVSKDGQRLDNQLKSCLYLTISNQAALQEILKHWNASRRNPHYKFPHGLTALRELFTHLLAIRFWDTEDRIRTTGIVDDWKERLTAGEQVVPVEIELHFRDAESVRNNAAERIRRNVAKAQGRVITQCTISEIRYHGILAQLPIESVASILTSNQQHIDLFSRSKKPASCGRGHRLTGYAC